MNKSFKIRGALPNKTESFNILPHIIYFSTYKKALAKARAEVLFLTFNLLSEELQQGD